MRPAEQGNRTKPEETRLRKLISALSSMALLFSLAGSAMAAGPVAPAGGNAAEAPKVDNIPSPMATKQAAMKQVALQQVMKGEAKATGKNKVVKLAPGQYVELARQGEDTIWTVLGEFGDQVSPVYGGDPGPINNEIPEPDRSVDNSTIWAPDFNQSYYENMLFNADPGAVSMRNFYIEQSSNRYTVNGTVEDWVQVPYNESYYGSDYCGGIVCARTWLFIQDTVNAWYNEMIADGMTPAEINDYLSSTTTGIGTTTTATATSISRMGTSTTSRPSMRVRARRPVAAPRAPTPSGAIAGTPSTT